MPGRLAGRLRRLAKTLLLALGMGAGAAMANPAFDHWAEQLAADWVRLSPETATGLQYFDGAEQAALDRRLSPQDGGVQQRRVALARRALDRLGQWEAGSGGHALTPTQRIAAATMRFGLARQVDGARFADHDFAFDQRAGLHLRQVRLFTQTQPLRRADDLPAFLARLAEAPLRLDEAMARTRRAARRGMRPPRVIIERAQAQVRELLAAAPASNPIVDALARRSAAIAALEPAQREAALKRARELVADGLQPAWQRLAALLDELHAESGEEVGLWRLPDGHAAYAQALAEHTTTTLDADAIHAIGLREVARLEGELDALLRRLGHREGSVRKRLAALNAAQQMPAQPDPRPALLARYAAYVADAQRRSQALFSLQPRAPIEVRREPALTERSSSAHYTTPARDGSRPGIFWVPLPGPRFNTLGMRSLAVHEAVPGHHFQLALQQESTELPRWQRQRVFGGATANTEGWALYAERLAIEQGWYDEDPHSLVGALASQLFRARRLVVDTGLHARRWTRQQAIDYGISAREVERYIANPGQACAYMIGMLRILELREHARQALGDRFSLPAFHDVVLRTGVVPLEVLAQVVREWVATRRG